MMRGMSVLAVVGVLSSVSFAGDLKSGLEVGEKAPAFIVRDVTGPNQGKSLCYRCSYGGRPVVSVFTRGADGKISELVKELDLVVGENADKQMRAFVVLLSDDEDADAGKLTKLAEDKEVKSTPLTIFDGLAGPPEYKIAKDADVTVLMWRGQKVLANHAFKAGELDGKAVKSVVADTAKLLAE